MWLLKCHGSLAFDAWEMLRAHKAQTGHSPVLIGDANSRSLLLDDYDYTEGLSTAELLQQASQLNGQDILARRWAEALDNHTEQGWEAEQAQQTDFYQMMTNTDPDALVDVGQIYFDNEYRAVQQRGTEKYLDECFLLLIPDLDETTAPAYLRYGNWNEYPRVEEHVAILRYWRARREATLVAITFDTVEFSLPGYEDDAALAIEVAREHFSYCPDRVLQGAGSIQQLAQNLVVDNTWFFWWD